MSIWGNLVNRITKTIGAAALTAAILFAAPVAASASTIYPPSDACTATPATVTAGGVTAFSCGPQTFSADETVTITVTGENGSSAQVGMVRFAISTAHGSAQSAADGSLGPVNITLPSDASGTYNIAAVSPTSAGGAAAVSITTDDGDLATTGGGTAPLGLWVGGGALVLAGAALVSAVLMRRFRHAD